MVKKMVMKKTFFLIAVLLTQNSLAQQWSDRGGDFQPTPASLFGLIPVVLGILIAIILVINKVQTLTKRNNERALMSLVKKNKLIKIGDHGIVGDKYFKNPTLSMIENVIIISAQESEESEFKIIIKGTILDLDITEVDVFEIDHTSKRFGFLINLNLIHSIEIPFDLDEQELMTFYEIGKSLIRIVNFGGLEYYPLQDWERKYLALKAHFTQTAQ
jgi:uncharacterized integral membrane protein